MKIYGVALLAGCYLLGQLLGNLLGQLIDVNGNVGGVGFGMVLLILASHRLKVNEVDHKEMELGITFWTHMYIPVIVAMAATQNVKAALSGGWVAILAGVLATSVCFFLVPALAKIGKGGDGSV